MAGEEGLGNFITNHYKSFFMSSAGVVNDQVLSHIHAVVSHDMNEHLTYPAIQ